jgi:UDP-glucose 4-epimerase
VADQIFMVSDGHDCSVADIVAAVAQAMGNHPRLFPLPKRLLGCLFTLLGQRPVIDRLTQPLTLDIAKIKAVLGWRPPFSVVEGIADTVDWFRRSRPHGA